MTEKEYRIIPGAISSSDIRLFLQSRKKFYNQVVLGQRVESEETVSTILGSIADCILTCPEEMDSRFVISTGGVPAGQLGELCEALYKRSLKSLDADGIQTDKFEVLFIDAVNSIKYDRDLVEVKFKGKSIEKIIELFSTPDKDGVVPEQYYKEKLNSIGKTVVSVSMMESGEKHANDLKESPYTADIVNAVTTDRKQVFHQLIVEFVYRDVKMRAMMDIVEVDHDRKTIQPSDVKTTYDNEGFDRTYLKGLYIQAATYDAALHKWAREQSIGDYDVLPMKYPVADTQNENMPLLYQLTTEDIKKAYTGFQLRSSSKHYTGLDEAIESIKWHVETGNWKISREAHQKGGKLYMEFEYV